MRRLLACSPALLLVLSSPALANGPVSLFRSVLFEPVPLESHTFRVSTSPSAYLEAVISNQIGGGFVYPGDAPHVDAFIADLTNGLNDPVTLTNGSFSYTVDEDFFLGEIVTTPFTAYAQQPSIFVGHTDLTGFTFWRFEVSGVSDRYYFTAEGTAPEPSSLIMVALCACSLHGLRAARSPRSTGC